MCIYYIVIKLLGKNRWWKFSLSLHWNSIANQFILFSLLFYQYLSYEEVLEDSKLYLKSQF